MRTYPALIALALLSAAATAAPAGCSANGTWWYETTEHGAGYKNVRAFGAKGDGITDDTAAILSALTDGRQPVYSVATPTAIYFPPGTYIVSATLPIYFYTFISGSPCAPSIIKLAENLGFSGYVFDGDKGQGEWGAWCAARPAFFSIVPPMMRLFPTQATPTHLHPPPPPHFTRRR